MQSKVLSLGAKRDQHLHFRQKSSGSLHCPFFFFFFLAVCVCVLLFENLLSCRDTLSARPPAIFPLELQSNSVNSVKCCEFRARFYACVCERKRETNT